MELKLGDKVKLNRNVERFKYGSGLVRYDEIGEIIGFNICNDITVNFPSQHGWIGLEKELVLVDKKKFFKRLPNDFTGTIEVENGYIVEKEILDDKEREYLSNVIKPFWDKVKYIIKFDCLQEEYISIVLLNDKRIDLPCFKKGTMYKGMEIEEDYTLEELGL